MKRAVKYAIVVLVTLIVVTMLSRPITLMLKKQNDPDPKASVPAKMTIPPGTFPKLREETSSETRIHVISSMPVFKLDSVKTDSYKGLPQSKMKERMEEFVTAIQRTLNHPNVAYIHCLYDKPDVIPFVQSRLKSNMTKLLFHKEDRIRRYNTFFIFAYKHLKGKLVMINPADVYPGEGFELINRDTMAKKKILYALTRWGKVEKNCDMRKQASSNSCHDKRYLGSHDSYIFVPSDPYPNKTMHQLDIMAQDYGTENIAIWAYKTIAKYKVMNPCKTVKIYHLHCSGVRDAKRKRINNASNTGTVRPTDKLE